MNKEENKSADLSFQVFVSWLALMPQLVLYGYSGLYLLINGDRDRQSQEWWLELVFPSTWWLNYWYLRSRKKSEWPRLDMKLVKSSSVDYTSFISSLDHFLKNTFIEIKKFICCCRYLSYQKPLVWKWASCYTWYIPVKEGSRQIFFL